MYSACSNSSAQSLFHVCKMNCLTTRWMSQLSPSSFLLENDPPFQLMTPNVMSIDCFTVAKPKGLNSPAQILSSEIWLLQMSNHMFSCMICKVSPLNTSVFKFCSTYTSRQVISVRQTWSAIFCVS